MNRIFTIFLIFIFLVSAGKVSAEKRFWEKADQATMFQPNSLFIQPEHYQIYTLSSALLKAELWNLSDNPDRGTFIPLPTPDGRMRHFRVWLSEMMEEGLALKYPGIKTFTGIAQDDPSVTAQIDFTEFGFHALVFDGSATFFIDPVNDQKSEFYLSYYKRDLSLSQNRVMSCLVGDELSDWTTVPAHLTQNGLPNLKLKVNGASKRTFRLALACTGEYAVAVAGANPTKSAVLAKMVTSMNRVNGVYQKELGVKMNLISNNDTIIFLNGTTDPYTNSNGGSMLSQNQTTCNNYIGASNYDIGHVFSTGGGGIAQLGSVCKSSKAQGVTGSPNPQGDAFDIDYVAHEIGHQFGAEHTFNANSGSCAGNGVSSSAYEPGSGSTIMAYAGICGSGDNIQNRSDDYFHAKSLDQISTFLTTATCASISSSLNTPPVVGAFTKSYQIPMRTPFELTAPAVIDSDHDKITYCWEQWNRGDFQQSWANVRLRGPIFRSFKDTLNPTRVFPQITKVIQGISSYQGEKLPDTTRFLTFKLTVRDILNGNGTFNLPDDTIHLDVTHTAGPFKVLTPSTAVNWTAVTNQTITWDVANTNMSPVNCANVDIYLSTDGGYNFPILLASNTPNDGSENVFIQNVNNTTNMARIKVKCSNNVFFNMNPVNFTITKSTSSVAEVAWSNYVKIYPVPAREVLNLINSYSKPLEVAIYNILGQQLWLGKLEKHLNIPLAGWSGGVYYVQLTEMTTGEKLIRPVVVQ
jgi:hypothetical protein